MDLNFNDVKSQRYAEITRVIDNYVDKTFVAPPNFVVPFGKTVIVKQTGNADMMKTDAGVLLIESNANNHLIPHIGHIFAVGPECSEHIKPGLRVFWNQFANLEVMIKGEVYMIIEEREVYGVLPDSAYARIDGLSDKEVGTKERVQRQEGFIDRKFAADQEEKDTLDFLKNKGK